MNNADMNICIQKVLLVTFILYLGEVSMRQWYKTFITLFFFAMPMACENPR